MQRRVQRIALAGPAVEPTERGATALADAYWAEVRKWTGGLVRARRTPTGLELRLAGAVTLFRFAAPVVVAGGSRVECTYPIAGGLLAKREGGSLAFVQSTEPVPELVVAVSDYVPFLSSTRERRSLRGFFYRQVQERAHAAIGRRYLARMAATVR